VIDQKINNPDTPMVINMSLGSRRLFRRIQEIDDAVAAGIVVVTAAGNEARNSCRFLPAYVPSAIAVGASVWNDRVATFSNHGACVDIFAPGVNIKSAIAYGDEETGSFSGTSMAAPHVAGAAALYLHANPTWTPDQVWNAMRDDAADVAYFGERFLPFRKLARFFRNRKTTGLLLQVQNI
jgi:subtilisin family serine protease